MSIAMDRFGSNEQRSETLASSGLQGPTFPYRLQCRNCGYEPFDVIVRPPHCPKCAGSSWEQFAYPGSLLVNADRRAPNGRPMRS
jgi:predicted nucleic-acid-binding Zn-ribbon protein